MLPQKLKKRKEKGINVGGDIAEQDTWMEFSKYLKYSSPHVDSPGQNRVSGFLISTENMDILS